MNRETSERPDMCGPYLPPSPLRGNGLNESLVLEHDTSYHLGALLEVVTCKDKRLMGAEIRLGIKNGEVQGLTGRSHVVVGHFAVIYDSGWYRFFRTINAIKH